MNNKIWFPLRSGLIVLMVLLAEELIKNQDFILLFNSLPYIIGVALAFVAIEYARVYKVDLTKINKKGQKVFMPLLLP